MAFGVRGSQINHVTAGEDLKIFEGNDKILFEGMIIHEWLKFGRDDLVGIGTALE